MPEMTGDDLGRRIFHLQKEKAVENAIEKIRHEKGSGIKSLSKVELEMLKHLLGEAWVLTEREEWQRSSFSRLTEDDLKDIILIAEEVHKTNISEKKAVERVQKILTGNR